MKHLGAVLHPGVEDPFADEQRPLVGADDAVLVIDETGFPKQGKAPCGVGHQYPGLAAR